MFGALFREYIVIFSENRREGNRFPFVNRFLNFGAFIPLFYIPW